MTVPRIPPLEELWQEFQQQHLSNLKPECTLYQDFKKVFRAGARAAVDNFRLETPDLEEATLARDWLQSNDLER